MSKYDYSFNIGSDEIELIDNNNINIIDISD